MSATSSRPFVVPSEAYRALIVNSTPEMNQLLTNLFDPREWKVQFARDNQDALRVARESYFDLIITGECSSGLEDIEMLRKLRMVRPHVRLIILTDEFVPGDVLNAIRERAFSYFSRPFSTERLADIINVAMNEAYWDDGIEVLSATPNWVRLSVRADVFTANRLIQFYREASGLPDAETEEVASAFREILLNAIEHGAGFDPTKFVEIGYLRTRRMVICRVKDPGTGFSLEELKHSALANPEEDPFQHMAEREARGLRPGGFGILMAKRLVDDLYYNEQGNEAILIKYLDSSREEAQVAKPE